MYKGLWHFGRWSVITKGCRSTPFSASLPPDFTQGKSNSKTKTVVQRKCSATASQIVHSTSKPFLASTRHRTGANRSLNTTNTISLAPAAADVSVAVDASFLSPDTYPVLCFRNFNGCINIFCSSIGLDFV